jgi:hypothetical protein
LVKLGDKVLVATTGRVRMKVDATSGPIRIGDLLVTGEKEGFAMKSQPINVGGAQIHRPGTLIGKALEPLEGGTGEIRHHHIRGDEFEAVLQRLLFDEIVAGRKRYAMSRLKTVSDDDEYVVASVGCLEPGTGQAQDVARTMIDELNPQWILLVGIAGSMPDHEYTLGNVILASRLHDFSVSAIIEKNSREVKQEFAIGGGPMHQCSAIVLTKGFRRRIMTAPTSARKADSSPLQPFPEFNSRVDAYVHDYRVQNQYLRLL